MTMKITVTNNDSVRVATVADVTGPKGEPDKQHVTTVEIAPLATAEFWLHSGRHVVIEEKA